MYKTFADLKAKRAKGDNGFTLIELLVVVVILGVLIAIAIPVYLNYRKGANDSASESDVRNAVSVLEVCNASGGYPTATTAVIWGSTTAAATTTVPTPCTGQTITTSSGTVLKYIQVAASGGTAAGYILAGANNGGAPKYWCYNSTKGGAVADKTPATLPADVTAGVTALTC